MSSSVINLDTLPSELLHKITAHFKKQKDRDSVMNTTARLRQNFKEEPFDYSITSDVFKKAYRSALRELQIDANIDYNKEIDKFIEKNRVAISVNYKISIKKLSILYLKSINVVNPKNATNLKNIVNLANCYKTLSECYSEIEIKQNIICCALSSQKCIFLTIY